MATKRSSPTKRAAKAKKGVRMAEGRKKGNVEVGPIVVSKIRVPINEKVYQKKESELAQIEVEIAKKKRSIQPTQNEIRQLRKQVAGLTVDIENNTEERDEKVKHEFHFNTNEVRVYRASDGKLMEKRTMTSAERKRNLDIEDGGFTEKTKANGESAAPTEDPNHAFMRERADADAPHDAKDDAGTDA